LGYGTDTGTSFSGYKDITDAPHYVEIHYVRATDVGSSDGTCQWWIDGVSQDTFTNLDNYDVFAQLQHLQMGLIYGTLTGASGTYYLDELVVNDDGSEIGPLATTAPAEANQVQVSDVPTFTFYPGQTSQASLYPTAAIGTASAPYNGLDWTSPTNIYADDTNYAAITSNSFDTGTISHLLAGWKFGATIPTAATINGLYVEIARYMAGSARDSIVTLWNGGIIGSNLGSTGVGWPATAPGTISYGGSNNLWGTTPTPAMVNGTSFGIGLAAVASALNTDVYVDFYRLTIYYTPTTTTVQFQPNGNWQAQASDAASVEFLAGLPTITGAENNQAQVSDAVILGVLTPIAPAEDNQAQVSNAAILGVTYPITAAEDNQAQISDAVTLGVYTVIAPAEDNQAQVSDAVTSVEIHPIAPAQNNQVQVSDAAVLGVTYPIAPAEDNQAQVSDAATMGVISPIAPAENVQAQVSDEAPISFAGEIAVEECHQAQVSDAASISVIYVVTAYGKYIQGTVDTPAVYYLLGAAENAQAQVSDAAELSVGGLEITAAENNQAQASDAATFGVIHPIAPAEDNQAQASDAALLGVITPIAPAQNNQAQVSDEGSLTVGVGITAAECNQAQVSDAVTIGVITPIAPSQQNQAQVSDAAVMGVYTPIAPAQNNQAQTSEAVLLGTYTPIATSQQNQAQKSDAVSISAISPISVAEAAQAQVSDAVTLSAQGPTYNITAAECNQIQVSDAAELTILQDIWNITPAEMHQGQVSDLVIFLILHGTRKRNELKVRMDSVFAIRSDYELGTRVDLEVDDE